MTAPLSATTELEAVNELLEAVGEAPISSLDVTGRTDVAIAKQVLNRAIRTLCARGWFWNTDIEYVLTLNEDNKFPVPSNALRIDPTDTSVNVTIRGSFLWDLDNHTDTFTDRTSLKCDIVRALPFDDLTQAAREYVAAVAGRTFAKRVLGDQTLVAYTQEDVDAAMTLLRQEESDNADHSLYQDATTMRVIGRFRDFSGGYVLS